jgi:flavin reductase (DIM6/NTAB) family NADH-FMN oxidoreductase RutF
VTEPATAFEVAELEGRAAYRLLTSALVPRPIAWVSTRSLAGAANLAPYSFFNAVASDPLTVMFAPGRRADGSPKDSLQNARETGEFVVNLADETLAEALNHTSGAWPHGTDEFAKAGLEAAPSSLVPVSGSSSTLVLGQVLVIHVRRDLLEPDGLIDAARYRPIARLGRDEYSTLGRVFSLARPKV